MSETAVGDKTFEQKASIFYFTLVVHCESKTFDFFYYKVDVKYILSEKAPIKREDIL